MSISAPFNSLRFFGATLLALVLSAAGPAAAQQVLVQNGATVEIKNSGVWDLQGATMDFGSAGATATLGEQSGGRVYNGQLTATRALSGPSSADPAGLGIEISASTDLGDVTVTRGHAIQTASNGNESIERYYDVSPSQNNSGLSAELTFTYNDAELNGRTESELEFFKSTDGGTSWSEEGFDSRDATANTVTLSGIGSFSRWTLGSEASPLPVELTQFEGSVVRTDGQSAVRLQWRTASETGSAGFEVQRRGETDSWQQIGFVESKTPGGTTADPQAYRFTDEGLPYAADSLRYRLRQVDTDGSATLTDPVAVARGAVEGLQLKKTFPNPTRQRVTVRYAVPEKGGQEVTLRLYDVLGRQVRSVRAPAEPGRHERTLSVGDLASGIYFLRLRGGDTVRTRRLTVVR